MANRGLPDSHMGVSLGTRLFYNEEHERRIAEIKRQKEELLNDQSWKYHNINDSDDLYLADVYKEMRNFYKSPGKHESPTRRLRQQMDTAWAHKEFLSKQEDFNRKDYGITYVVGVSNTYCVQPENGELPYEMVEKSPQKFYREVMNSEVKEHKVTKSPKKQRNAVGRSAELPMKKRKTKSTLEYRQRICKRSVARILSIVQSKMGKLIRNLTGDKHTQHEINRAMSNPNAEKILRRQITDGSVKLVHQESQQPAFTKQMTKIGEQGFDRARQQTQTDAGDESFFQQDPEDCEIQFNNTEAKNEYVGEIVNIIKQDSVGGRTSSKGFGTQ